MAERQTREQFRQFLYTERAKIISAIRPETGVKYEAVCHSIVAVRNESNKLQECSSESILLAACQGLRLGFELTKALGHFYIVPYKGAAVGQIGYKGLIQLAYRSGQIRSIETHNVYENEEFKVDWGMEPPIFHSPQRPTLRGEFLAAYTKISTTTGGVIWELMWSEEIDVIAGRAASKDGPWKTDRDEMRRKTVTKRGLKYAPASARLQAALAADDMADIGEPILPPTADDATPPPADKTAGSDMDALAAKSEAKRGNGGQTHKAKADMKPTSGPPAGDPDRTSKTAAGNAKGGTKPEADYLTGEKVRAKNLYTKLGAEARAEIMLARGLDDSFGAIDDMTSGPELVELFNTLNAALERQKAENHAPDVSTES